MFMIRHKDPNYDIDFIETPEEETQVFNRNRFLRNLFYAMKKLDMKVGELEAKAGVSSGYIARLGKSTATPSVEVVMKIATALNMSVDTILKRDILQVNEQEQYLISFINRLNEQTLNRELEWCLQTIESLRYVDKDKDGNITHPLFSEIEVEEYEEETGYPITLDRVVFISDAYGRYTGINGDGFKVSIDDNVDLYLMNVVDSTPIQGHKHTSAIEIWIDDYSKKPYFLCGTQNIVFKEIINDLYLNVKEYSKFPSLKDDTKNIIDKFMQKTNPT